MICSDCTHHITVIGVEYCSVVTHYIGLVQETPTWESIKCSDAVADGAECGPDRILFKRTTVNQ